MTISTTSIPRVTLAYNDVEMPLIGYGTHPLRGEDAATAVATAIEVGFRSIDTATRYRNQDGVGEGIRRSGIDRGEIFLTSKLPPDSVGMENDVLEESLAQFQTEYLDLWLIHWPPGGNAGITAWEALIAARERGLVRAIGVSNYSLKLLDALKEATGYYPEVNQLQWSPVHYSKHFLAGCKERRVTVGAHSPFRSARLDDPLLTQIAERHRVSPRQVIVRWNIQHQVAVVPKSARRARMKSNLEIDFRLSSGEMQQLDALSEVG